jgi:iron complex outermembrane receptor protein
VSLRGKHAESSGNVEHQMAFDLEDERNFSGLYTQLEWNPTPRVHVQVGGRLNRTNEDREAGEAELDPDAGGEEGEEEHGTDSRTVTRGSGAIGLSYLAWTGEGDGDGLWLFADARDTYKPAVLDFGPEAEDAILKPETARSYEAGIKGQLGRGRLDFEATVFQMDFDNLVVSQVVNGLPALVNAGQQRFQGYEIETRYHFLSDLLGTLAWSHHDSKFRDYVQDFDGVATQLRGKRLEMVPKELAALGLIYNPKEGVTGWATYQHVGERFLNKRNTALAGAYDTVSAGIGYRFSRYEVRLDGDNLTDERPPISESELGDAQYYLLPARSFRLGLEVKF